LAYGTTPSLELDVLDLVAIDLEVDINLVAAERIAVVNAYVSLWQLAFVTRIPIVIEDYLSVNIITQILNSLLAS
jgi:hypothetical protein